MQIRKKLKTVVHLGMNELDTILIKSLFYPTYIDRVHISFDDVHESFREAVDMNCDSIFEIPFFSSLKKLNKVYGAKFSLYIFEDEKLELKGSLLRDLEQCRDWISIGYHARVDGMVDSQSFYRFYERFRNSGLLSKSCRFHGFSTGNLSVVEIKNSEIVKYKIPSRPVLGMQVMEYARTFLASRILKDLYGGNLIISGAFGLFKKDYAVAVGGYDSSTLGEDMELVMKLHVFCINNHIKYKIAYEPEAICWSQAPGNVRDLMKQRRRWHLGLFQCMTRYYYIFANIRFGLLSFVSYLYYLFFELLSPIIETMGLGIMIIAQLSGLLNVTFLINFFILYSLFGTFITLTAFFQRIYTRSIKLSFMDGLKAIALCLMECLFFRYLLSFVRITAFIGYKKRKHSWGSIKREKMS